jgi:hypothetical protein
MELMSGYKQFLQNFGKETCCKIAWKMLWNCTLRYANCEHGSEFCPVEGFFISGAELFALQQQIVVKIITNAQETRIWSRVVITFVEGTVPAFSWRCWVKPRSPSVRVAGTRTENPPNKSLEHCFFGTSGNWTPNIYIPSGARVAPAIPPGNGCSF